MTTDNVEIVRMFVDAFNRREVDQLEGYYDPDVELDEWPNAPGAGRFKGVDAVRTAVDGWFEVWDWMKVEIVELVDAGDRVLVVLDQRAKGIGSEVEVEIRSYNAYSFRDGKVTRIQLFTEREPALEAAGLSPHYQEEKR